MKLKRQHILLLLSGLLLVAGIRLVSVLQHTAATYSLAERAKERRQKAERAAYVIEQQETQLTTLKTKAQSLQSQGVHLSDPVAFSNYLESICKVEKVQIISLPLTTVEQVADYRLSEERFSLQGSLSTLLKVIYRLEQEDRIGTITYSRFQKKTIRRKGREEHLLLVDLVLKRLAGGDR